MADRIEPEKKEQIDSSEVVALELRRVLQRLKLDQPAYLELVPPAELIKSVLEQPQTAKPGDLAYRAICRKIYEACNSTDPARQNLAYQWLGTYLYYGIRLEVADETQAEDLTNDSLEVIFKKFDNCHTPEFFLAWAARIATRKVLQHLRKQAKIRREKGFESLQKVQEEFFDSEPALNELAGSKTLEPENVVLSQERLEMILKRINLFRRGKRAKHYRAIFYGTYFLGLQDEELAEKLGLSVTEIQKMRSHVLTRLRSDSGWIDSLR